MCHVGTYGLSTTRANIFQGTLIHQPPFNRHRELEQSEDFEVIEITLPGTIKNVFMDYDESSKDWTYSDTYKGRNTK